MQDFIDNAEKEGTSKMIGTIYADGSEKVFLKEVEKRLEEGSYVVEKAAAMDGRFMSMTLNAKAK